MLLVTGGSGYVGSHACIELINAGYELLVLDNFSNSSLESLNRVEHITNRSIPFIEGDIRDKSLLRSSDQQCNVHVGFTCLFCAHMNSNSVM